MIRIEKALNFATWSKAFYFVNWSRAFYFAKWSTAILLIGMLVGAMAVILPPMASISVVGLIGVLLLWVMPDLHAVPDKLLRRMFFIMVFVQLCVPAYYAIDTGVLPWISVRRLFAVTVIALFALTVAGSQSAREKIAETINSNRLLVFFPFGFLAMLVLSLLTAAYPIGALSGVLDTFLTWYVPLFACILVVRTEKDVILLLKIIAIAGIVDSLLGAIEFFLERRYFFDIFPKSMLESMLATNPALEVIYNTIWYRNGIYRASSIFTVPLSFGELAAMVAPLGAYFFFHGENLKWRAIGFVTVSTSIGTLVISGARGGFVAFLVSMPIMLFLWTIRYSKANRSSLVGTIMGGLFLAGTIAMIGLVLTWRRLSNIVLGGGETAGSTDARFVQWQMAVPHILGNPITGHGKGAAGNLVGYYNPGSAIPTIDSYVITLLVEQGIPGFLLFFGMIGLGIWIGVRLYIGNADERAAIGAPLACCLIAFAVYRLALSQTENHTLLFLIVGLVFAVAKLSQDWKSNPARTYFPSGDLGGWQRPLAQPGRQPDRIRY